MARTWVFVKGHKRPVVRDVSARYVRQLPNGEPMLAEGPKDSIGKALARYEAAKRPVDPMPERAEEQERVEEPVKRGPGRPRKETHDG